MKRVVPSPAREFGVPAMVRDWLAVGPRVLCRSVISFLFLGLVFFGILFGGATTARAFAGNPPATWLGPGLTFAIADLDGDRRPDFASIQAGQNRPDNSDYSIQIYFCRLGGNRFTWWPRWVACCSRRATWMGITHRSDRLHGMAQTARSDIP